LGAYYYGCASALGVSGSSAGGAVSGGTSGTDTVVSIGMSAGWSLATLSSAESLVSVPAVLAVDVAPWLVPPALAGGLVVVELVGLLVVAVLLLVLVAVVVLVGMITSTTGSIAGSIMTTSPLLLIPLVV